VVRKPDICSPEIATFQHSISNHVYVRKEHKADVSSRQRKTKCSGERPTCSPCALRRLHCTWSSPSENNITHIRSPPSKEDSARSKRPRFQDCGSGHGYPSMDLISHALEIFRVRHLSVEFCAFLHMPSIDITALRQRCPFLVHALIALAALYMDEGESTREGFEGPEQLSEWYASIAKEYSRQSVDSPSSTSELLGHCYITVRGMAAAVDM
jgi:hypothetical protein